MGNFKEFLRDKEYEELECRKLTSLSEGVNVQSMGSQSIPKNITIHVSYVDGKSQRMPFCEWGSNMPKALHMVGIPPNGTDQRKFAAQFRRSENIVYFSHREI